MRHVRAASRLDLFKTWASTSQEGFLDPELPPPADIQASLLALVDDAAAVYAHAPQLPLLVQRRSSVVQRSIDILRIFRILQHSLEESSALVCP
jgi:hypothetical protein